ncbi:ABC transporter ATP-binding protein [Alteromonas sp. BMJM2]|uniref:ABC transporter ATP-binding protein n=1 Tax=Alteromonas sp. BMJM2 TaxID=2954241 RepID=UPI0022B4A8AB|nr:ABC transporter ATP-binding protein [Alteromonas sp. BMJM2]
MFIKHFSEYVLAYRQKYAFVFFLMLLESGVSLAIPYFIGQFSSVVLDKPTIFGISQTSIVAIWIGLILLQALVRYQCSFRVNMIGANILSLLSCRLYDHVQMLPLSYFSRRKKGEILSLISNDVNVVAYFLSGILSSLVPSVLIALGALVLMASINIYLASLIAVTVPIFFIMLKLLSRRVRPISEMATKQQAHLVAQAAENFSTIQLLKSFGREKIESDKFKHSTKQMLSLRKNQFHLQALLSPVIQMIISMGIVFIILASIAHYRSGDLSIPDLITLLMYGLLFAKPMSNLAASYGQYQQADGASTRIIDVFAIAPEATNDLGKILNFKHGDIKLSSLSFKHEQSIPLLHNVNAEFKGKSVSVIIGDNGAGKTTLLHLLMRFIQPQSGNIFIDGQDIQDCNLASLRSHIALVSQDVALCHGSVYENIAYGRPQTSKEEAIDAAKRAGADRFITALENAYETQVGDNGVLLSAGQRQKVSLARALLLESKVIIFDEPTSYADSQGRAEFFDLLQTQLFEHTVIVVTHDHSLTEAADAVYQIKDNQLKTIN